MRVLPRVRHPDPRGLRADRVHDRLLASTGPTRFKFGTVGPPLPGFEVKLAEDGELLIRSETVFAGYFKDEEATREVLDERRLAAHRRHRADRRGRLPHDHRPQEGHHRHRRRQERRAAEPRERAEGVEVRLAGARRRRPAPVRRRADHARRGRGREVARREAASDVERARPGDRRRGQRASTHASSRSSASRSSRATSPPRRARSRRR